MGTNIIVKVPEGCEDLKWLAKSSSFPHEWYLFENKPELGPAGMFTDEFWYRKGRMVGPIEVTGWTYATANSRTVWKQSIHRYYDDVDEPYWDEII
jgi:hypothetical protein